MNRIKQNRDENIVILTPSDQLTYEEKKTTKDPIFCTNSQQSYQIFGKVTTLDSNPTPKTIIGLKNEGNYQYCIIIYIKLQFSTIG